MSDKQILSVKLIKKDGKLVPATPLEKERYKLFIAQLSDDAKVDAVMELKSQSNTRAQLKKIHAMIREIAAEQGESVEQAKRNIKRECGMAYKENGKMVYESFADCSKEELSNVIETIIQIGTFLNINLKGLQ